MGWYLRLTQLARVCVSPLGDQLSFDSFSSRGWEGKNVAMQDTR